MDEKTRMENYTAENIVETIDEVRAARGEYGSLGEQTAQIKAAQTEISEIQKTQSEQETTITKAAEQVAVNKSSLGLQRKNLLKNNCKKYDGNGLTSTVSEDGIITLNGFDTYGGNHIYYWNIQTGATSSITMYTNNKQFFKKGKYILSGGIEGVRLQFAVSNDTSSSATILEATIDDNEVEVDLTEDYAYVWCRLLIEKNSSFNNAKIKPMVRYAEITDDTYEPYQPSLQEQIDELKSQLSELKGLDSASALLPEKQLYVVETPEEEIVESEVE